MKKNFAQGGNQGQHQPGQPRPGQGGQNQPRRQDQQGDPRRERPEGDRDPQRRGQEEEEEN